MKGSNQFETVGNEVEFFLLCKNECQYKKRKIFGWKFVHWDYLESDYYLLSTIKLFVYVHMNTQND